MTVEEIFTKLANHMIEGVKTHYEFANAYEFLGLEGFAKEHNYHTIEEKCGLIHLLHYYFKHYHKLLKTEEIPTPKIIPDNWYKYTTIDVDANTKRNAIKDFIDRWIAWERSTKKLYQDMRQELTNIGEIAAALYIDKYIADVSKELKHAEEKQIHIATINYDLIEITSWQDAAEKKYKKKLGW